jgi:hypothetical protein
MLFRVQGLLIAMSYELSAVFKGEGMDLKVMQSRNKVLFTLKAKQRQRQR